MSQLNISAADLSQHASQLKNMEAEVNSIFSQIRSKMNHVQSIWSSPAASRLMSEFQELYEAENLQQVEKQENGEERNSSISNDETETNVTHEKDQELSNGEHIRFQLGSQAKIDAVVDMPDKKWNEFEKCMIEVA